MPKLVTGDCIEELKKLPDNSVDAIVTDPPYGLKFMGKEFDNLGEGAQQREWHKRWAVEAIRVLKPGGHLLAFGGTRTYHHLATAVEDAGFEIRDQMQWLYGSGFPKSHNVGKALQAKATTGSSSPKAQRKAAMGKKYKRTPLAGTPGYGVTGNFSDKNTGSSELAITDDLAKQWEGWGTALKPANEPIVVARKPFKGTVAENVQEHGTGAINIEEARIGGKDGRWPANIILDPEAGAMLDGQSGERPGAVGMTQESSATDVYGAKAWGGKSSTGGDGQRDTGGASRFFYCPKAAKGERNAGLDGFKNKPGGNLEGNVDQKNARKIGARPEVPVAPVKNAHPTVKPIDLMRYLCRLVTPPGGTVLDPFLGSGTTGIAAHLEGFEFIGIEREADYMEIAAARISWWTKQQGETKEILKKSSGKTKKQEK